MLMMLKLETSPHRGGDAELAQAPGPNLAEAQARLESMGAAVQVARWVEWRNPSYKGPLTGIVMPHPPLPLRQPFPRSLLPRVREARQGQVGFELNKFGGISGKGYK